MIDRSDYPTEPGYKALGPSADAAEAIAGVAGTLRNQVRSTIAAAPQGLTVDEVAAKLNKSVLSVRPRAAELHRQGEFRQTGTGGKNASGMSASIWVTAPPLSPDQADSSEVQK
jgi:hypothetical protein